MSQEPFNNHPPCAVCGERAADTQVLITTEQGRRLVPMCESCAREIAEGMAQAGERLIAERQERGTTRTQTRTRTEERSKTPALDAFGRDLTAEARAGRIDPVVGRDEEIAQTVEILARRRKNNAVLIGEAGVGKTAIAEGLARRVAAGDVPETLHGARIVALDLGAMVAGSQYRGQFEQRLKTVLKEVTDANDPATGDGRVVLFLDELHTVLGAGGSEGAMDAANLLKPALARGELQLIGATTLAEYRAVERDAALARRFSAVTIDEPTVEQTVAILQGLRSAYEQHHGCTYTDAALAAAARLSDRYLPEQQLPDKAIDLIDQAGAKLRLARPADPRQRENRLREELQAAVKIEDYEHAAWCKQQLAQLDAQTPDGALGAPEDPASDRIDEAEIAAIVAARTGIPVGELQADELGRLAGLEDDLRARVVGQDEAIAKVADTIRRGRVGLSEADRPLGSFLFLGPTGVGKTELVKTLAARLFAREDALVRFDMSEFRAPHTVARLIGSPPGYVGYGEGGQLTEAVRRHPYSVVLLDEIEKAHPEVWNVLLQLLDDGRMTDGEGRTVDFTNTVIVMTSNLGAGRAQRGTLGFAPAGAGAEDERMRAAAKDAFLPEFLNRIDEIVTFHALGSDEVEQITRLITGRVAERLLAEHRITLTVSDALIAQLAADGFDEAFGARPLQRHVRRTLERALTDAIVAGRLTGGQAVTAGMDENGAVKLT